MDRLSSLTAFVQVVETGGFSAAARRLSTSPTMISNHIQAIENRLGVRLLNRTTRKVSLTEIGREYYERCLQILVELEDADRAATAQQMIPRGQLRVHCHTTVGKFIAPMLACFLRDHPEVSVDLRLGDQMIDMLEEGFDVAIRNFYATRFKPDGTTTSQLAPRPMLLSLFLKTHPAPRSPADLAGHNCIRYAFAAFGDEWRFMDLAGKPLVVRATGNLVTSSQHVLRATALAGGGLLLTAPFIVHDEIETGSLIRLLPEYRTHEFSIVAVYPHRRFLAAKVRVFIDALVALFAQQWPWT